MKKIETNLSNEIPGVIITIHMANLINHFGKDRVLDAFYKKTGDKVIVRHINNMISTYGPEVFIDVLGIIQIEEAVWNTNSNSKMV